MATRNTLLPCLLFLLAALIGPASLYQSKRLYQPEQVHLSYGVGYSQMYVTWITTQKHKTDDPDTGMPTVEYGVEPFDYNLTATGTITPYNNSQLTHQSLHRVIYIHRVLLTNLEPDRDYYYHCGNPNLGWSEMFRFKTRPAGENWSPKVAVYGDMGYENGISIPFLQRQVSKNAYDAIFHVGDLGYDLAKENGLIGDYFMRQIEPIAAYVAYQTSVGNHEAYETRNFSDYDNRFTMIEERTGKLNNHYYSFSIGPAHVISFSSEYYYFMDNGLVELHNQFTWLQQDLEEASKPENRAKHPWIIAMAHRPMYCSTADADDCTQNESILRKGIPIVNQYGLEDLFYKHGVDIIFGAHEHTYERLFPVYNRQVYNGSSTNPYDKPKAPVHILVGSAGCNELPDPFVANPKPWSAKRIRGYGVTEMHIINGTHIRFHQRDTEHNGKIVDSFTVVKGKWN